MEIPINIRRLRLQLLGTSVALAMAMALSPGSRAQSTTAASAAPNSEKGQTAFDPRDLNGQWAGGVGGGLHTIGKVPPMLPEAQAKFNANTAELKAGGVITTDPTFRCEPPGVPHIYDLGSSMVEVYQSPDRPDRIFLFYEIIHTWRTIWMNNRPVSDNGGGLPRSLGFSLGHWEGNDLVVDTTGLADDGGWVNRAGYPHSDALHVVERFHRIDREHMRLDLTLEDPKSYTQPWKMAVDFTLKPAWDFTENFCRPSDSANFSGPMVAKPQAPPSK